jgi:hypothetical protein
MKLIIEEAAYGERFEKEWKGDVTFKVQDQLSIIPDYLSQYSHVLSIMMETEKNPVKKDIMFEKVKDIKNILNDHKDLFEFFHDSATVL